jgi:hypothetical protein
MENTSFIEKKGERRGKKVCLFGKQYSEGIFVSRVTRWVCDKMAPYVSRPKFSQN